jgi:hypothetical protein
MSTQTYQTIFENETGRVLRLGQVLVVEVTTGADRVGAKQYADASPEQTLVLLAAAVIKMHDAEINSRWQS